MITETRFHRVNAAEFCDRYGGNLQELSDIAGMLEVSKDGPWLVGGSVRRLITLAKQDSDFDVAFPSCSRLAETKELLIGRKFTCRESSFHDEFVGDFCGNSIKIQLLKVAYGTPESVMAEFDFTICQCGFDGKDLIFGPYSMRDIGRRRLAVNKITFAASSVRRMIKYSKQGYYACNGCAVDILRAVVSDPSIIRDDVEYVD